MQNERDEKRRTAALYRKKKKAETREEREAKGNQLDELLRQSAAFSDILSKKTQVLGRVGTGLGGKTLGEHNLVMAKQPKSVVGGTMRDYQLEGLTWMVEICSQGMSGILADEMGLGASSIFLCLDLIVLTQSRKNGPGHLLDCNAARARELPRPTSDCCSLEHLV